MSAESYNDYDDVLKKYIKETDVFVENVVFEIETTFTHYMIKDLNDRIFFDKRKENKNPNYWKDDASDEIMEVLLLKAEKTKREIKNGKKISNVINPFSFKTNKVPMSYWFEMIHKCLDKDFLIYHYKKNITNLIKIYSELPEGMMSIDFLSIFTKKEKVEILSEVNDNSIILFEKGVLNRSWLREFVSNNLEIMFDKLTKETWLFILENATESNESEQSDSFEVFNSQNDALEQMLFIDSILSTHPTKMTIVKTEQIGKYEVYIPRKYNPSIKAGFNNIKSDESIYLILKRREVFFRKMKESLNIDFDYYFVDEVPKVDKNEPKEWILRQILNQQDVDFKNKKRIKKPFQYFKNEITKFHLKSIFTLKNKNTIDPVLSNAISLESEPVINENAVFRFAEKINSVFEKEESSLILRFLNEKIRKSPKRELKKDSWKPLFSSYHCCDIFSEIPLKDYPKIEELVKDDLSLVDKSLISLDAIQLYKMQHKI